MYHFALNFIQEMVHSVQTQPKWFMKKIHTFVFFFDHTAVLFFVAAVFTSILLTICTELWEISSIPSFLVWSWTISVSRSMQPSTGALPLHLISNWDNTNPSNVCTKWRGRGKGEGQRVN